jgi:hypothetical protein
VAGDTGVGGAVGFIPRPLSNTDKSKWGSFPAGATSLSHSIPQHLNFLHRDFNIACKHTPKNANTAPDNVIQNTFRVQYSTHHHYSIQHPTKVPLRR